MLKIFSQDTTLKDKIGDCQLYCSKYKGSKSVKEEYEKVNKYVKLTISFPNRYLN